MAELAHSAARRAWPSPTSRTASRPRNGDRLPGAGATELCARRARDADRLQRRGAAAQVSCEPPLPSMRTSRCSLTNISSARSWRSTLSATGRMCSCRASWSLSSAPASTPVTPSASTRPSVSRKKVKDTILDYTKRLGLGIGIVGLFNIQFIVDKQENVYVIEVNPRSSRTVPFLSKATGWSAGRHRHARSCSASRLNEQGITEALPAGEGTLVCQGRRPSPSPSSSGLDAYLSPEMKSTGEAIGYDKKLTRALYKAIAGIGHEGRRTTAQCSSRWPTRDKEEALPLIRRFYQSGLQHRGHARHSRLPTRTWHPHARQGQIKRGQRRDHRLCCAAAMWPMSSTRATSTPPNRKRTATIIRRAAVENNVTMFTSLDTVKVLLDVLEEITIGVSTIDA